MRTALRIAITAAVAAALTVRLPDPVAHASAAAAQGRRIVAIGDIHGAAAAFDGLLRRTGLVDDAGTWTGGSSVLVQTGDYLDRGADARAALTRVMSLDRIASAGGGNAEILLGNHEVMNILRDFDDVTPAIFASFADGKSSQRLSKAYNEQVSLARRSKVAALMPESKEAWMAAHPPGYLEYVDAFSRNGTYGKWLRARKVVVLIDGTIFMHAGLTPDSTDSLDDVNRDVARAIRTWDDATDYMVRNGLIRPFFSIKETVAAAAAELQRISEALDRSAPVGDHVTQESVQLLTFVGTIAKSPLIAADGPMWYRGLTTAEPTETPDRVGALLKRLGATRFVLGHTPQLPGRITPKFGGLVYAIDTGMLTSYFKGGRPSALVIDGETLTEVYLDGGK